ncbi:OmpA family protein [Aquimarina celericrescens]|uniref:OmpA family protein n=1 Tax=Aquimarina celericrescens TaxID=1964542 RepID=A0ABW5ASK1_9FLAO|nr:OmpA family protein [Aquimarina celericrescens]
MKVSVKIVLLMFLMNSYYSNSQDRLLKKANNNYDKFAYVKAKSIYESIVRNGKATTEVYQKLGDCYYFNSDMENASKWYKEMIDSNEALPLEYYFRYAQTLKYLKSYDSADEIMMIIKNQVENDSRINRLVENPDYLSDIALQKGRYELIQFKENSIYTDFAPSFFKDQLVFSSSRSNRTFTDKKNKWTNHSYLDLYISNKENLNTSETDKFSRRINTRLHESTSVFTKDGSTVYFTRNNLHKQKFGKDSISVNRLKIFKATINSNGKWTKVRELPFNSDHYSVGHPALSPSEDKLYFVSDRPGGMGSSDLYVVDIISEDRYGKAKNLGPEINTEGRDTFPFISKSGKLYFASDGHLGLGGLDIFVTELYNSTIYNVGEPINSYADDVTFIIDEDTNKGFFASNRPGGTGDDDIYGFVETSPLIEKCSGRIRGLVKDKETGEVLSNIKTNIVNSIGKVLFDIYTDSDGKFIIEDINCNEKIYDLIFTTDGYKPKNTIAQLNKNNPDFYEEIELLALPKLVEVGADLAETLKLNPIYFNSNKYYIRKDAAIELDKVVTFLNENPLVSIEIRSHTDSTAGDWYNLWLSNKRASATVAYIVKKGIKPNRITGKGYGETRLKNECANNIPCSKEKHQLNRRSEFIVINN